MRVVGKVVAGLVALLILVVVVSALSNVGLPARSPVVERLSDLQKARLAEIFHLRETLGDGAWPGWGQADIPVIVYNEAYAFLVGYPDPPAGWVKVPQGDQRGGPWEPVRDDTFQGQTYYRQRLPASGVTPQAFTVRVGDRWVASLQTMAWMRISLIEQIREDLPPGLAQIVPYRLVQRVFLNSTDWYIAGVLHEAFHAYQGTVAPQRLAESERATGRSEDRYPWDDPALQDAWQTELNLLADAVRAESDVEAAELAGQFLAQRGERRQALGLSPDLIDYERQREWLEGQAKYVELEIWRQAATTPDYTPVADLVGDPDFKSYTTFEQRWSQEVDQIRRMAGDRGDGRFYYSGLAQATLLDRLMPAWKERALEPGVWLEDLLAEGLSNLN